MSQYRFSRMAAVKLTVRSPILASKPAVPLVSVVCPSAIRTWVGCPYCGLPCVCAIVGLTYDFCAWESSSAVTKPDLNSSSTVGRDKWFSTAISESSVADCTAITMVFVSFTSVLRLHSDGARSLAATTHYLEKFQVWTGDICDDAERVDARLMVISPSVLPKIGGVGVGVCVCGGGGGADRCPPTHLAFPEAGAFAGQSLFQCGPPQYLHGSRGCGLPAVPSRGHGACGWRGVRDCPRLPCSGIVNGCGGGSSGVSIIVAIWRRFANVLGRCSRMCVR
ncbi:Uncharacterized protein FWK35_00031988 [Aphis craccivora]|uniref:Uncharacterized protein n=1 Tax=Aphis craccivora TaxID=307492 RepID=A0A6G0VIE5_APHCR|nr:Uncharacterized protein FWK35_00031988 [Aphis craccivora]